MPRPVIAKERVVETLEALRKGVQAAAVPLVIAAGIEGAGIQPVQAARALLPVETGVTHTPGPRLRGEQRAVLPITTGEVNQERIRPSRPQRDLSASQALRLEPARVIQGVTLTGARLEEGQAVREPRGRRVPGCVPQGFVDPQPCTPVYRPELVRQIWASLREQGKEVSVFPGPDPDCSPWTEITQADGEKFKILEQFTDEQGQLHLQVDLVARPVGGEVVPQAWVPASELSLAGVDLSAVPVRKRAEVLQCPPSTAELGLPKGCALEIKTDDQFLAGSIKFEGRSLNLEAPVPVGSVSFALCDSIKERTYDIPIIDIRLNEGYDEQFGGVTAQNEVGTAVLYAHFRAWAHDGDDQFFEQRRATTFEDYLGMVRQGQDVGHTVWVAKEGGSVLDRVPVVVGPQTPIVTVFKSGTSRWGGVIDVKYDPQTGLEIEMDVIPGDPKVYPDSARVIGWNAFVGNVLAYMLYPSGIQRTAITPDNSERAFGYQDEMIWGIFSGNLELHLNVPVELVAGP